VNNVVHPIKAQKAALRRQVAAELLKLSPERQAAESARLRARLQGQELWLNSRNVLLFASMPGEVDLWPLISEALAEGKNVALPRYVSRTRSYVACQVKDMAADVVAGFYGIREPRVECAEEALNRLDFVLVPGVAFDLRGGRLGRGKGFYDRLLANVCGVTCGVAFDEQIVSEVPVEAHDVVLNCILTPTRWVERPRSALE
jgi:5-formyltetrahydrofolate cyclo-ligase